MLIQESATDSRVVVFDWLNMKIEATMVFIAIAVTKITCNPRDYT